MLNLFDKQGDILHIYLWRRPTKDGSAPRYMGMALASAAVLGALCGFIDTNPSASYLYKMLVYTAIFAWGCVYLARSFLRVSISRTDRSIRFGLPYFSWRIASLNDIGTIQVLQQEYGGEVKYCYAGIWRRDKMKTPVRLSPVCRTMNQLSMFQRAAIPAIRELVPRKPDAPPPATEEQGGEGAETAPGRDEAPSQSGRAFHNSFWIGTVCHTVFGVFLLVGACVVVWLARFGADDTVLEGSHSSYFFHVMTKWTILLKAFVVPAAGWRLYSFLKVQALKNVTVDIDPAKETIAARTFFGFVDTTRQFEDLAYISVKGFGMRRKVCLVVTDFQVDILARTAWSMDDAKAAVKETCAALRVRPRDWVDLLRPIHEWRFNSQYNPYREFDWDADQGFTTRKREWDTDNDGPVVVEQAENIDVIQVPDELPMPEGYTPPEEPVEEPPESPEPPPPPPESYPTPPQLRNKSADDRIDPSRDMLKLE